MSNYLLKQSLKANPPWKRCCSQQSKASSVQNQSISNASSASSTYYIITRRSSVPGGKHTNARDGIHRQVGQGIGEVSHFRHYGLILEEMSTIKGLLSSTPQQNTESTESLHACHRAGANTPQTAKLNTGLGQTHLLHFHLLLIRGYICSTPNRFEIWASSLF